MRLRSLPECGLTLRSTGSATAFVTWASFHCGRHAHHLPLAGGVDTAAVRDAGAGGVQDGGDGEGGGSVTWARRSFSKWQRQCC